MSKSRRDKFEEQLRALQTDINHLSYKMATPGTQSIISSTLHSSPQGKENLRRDVDGKNSPKSYQKLSIKHGERNEDSSYFSAQRNNFDLRLNNSIPVGNDEVSNGYRENGSNNMPEKEYGYKEDTGDVYALTRERNDLISRLEQSQKEIEELRKEVIQSRDLQLLYDRLIQDHNSVQISLESSERIRRQQKELINLLQRSAAVAENTQDFSLGASLSPSTTSTAAENRSWLNAFSNTNSKGSGDIDTESLSMSNQGRGDEFRRREEMFVPDMHRERSSQIKSKTSANAPKIKRKTSTVNRETLSSSARQTVTPRTNKSISGASSSGVSTRHVTNTIPTNTKVSARQHSHQRSNLASASHSGTPGHRGVTNGRQYMPTSRLDEQLASSIESLGLINKSNYNHSDGYSPVFESQSLSDNRLLAPDYPHHTRSLIKQPQASGVSSQRPRSAPPSSPMSLKSNRSPATEGKTRRASTSKGIADLNSSRSIYYNGIESRKDDYSQEVERDSKRDSRLVSNINSTLHSRNGRPPITPTYTSDKYQLNQYSYPRPAH